MLCPGDLALPEISFCRGPAGLPEAACGVIVACSVLLLLGVGVGEKSTGV